MLKMMIVWFMTLKPFYRAAIVGTLAAAISTWLATKNWGFASTLCSMVALYAFIDAWRNRNKE